MRSGHITGMHRRPRRATAAIEKRDVASCPNGNPYKEPSMNTVVDGLKPLNIAWNPICFDDSPKLDIIISAPDEEEPRVHAFTGVNSASGNYTAALEPRWWGAKSEQQLQITILPAGKLLFQAKYVAGPVIIATYTAPSDGSIPAEADTTRPIGPADAVTFAGAIAAPTGVSPGGKAAAVLIPLIVVGLCIAAFIKWKRGKQQEKTKAWTEKVDQRMSTISVDWKSVSGAGANAAIRNSMATGMRGSRTSSAFAFGAIRPSSTFAVEDSASMSEKKTPGARTTTGVGLRNPAGAAANGSTDRVSRVSFAPDTRVSRVSFADSRPSGESRRTRAYHSAYVPPVPALPGTHDDETSSNDDSGTMSPRQTEGAMALTPEAIRARINHAREDTRKDSMDGLIPALSMMRTGDDPASPDDFLFHQNAAAATVPAPAPAYIAPSTAMDPVPASVMSPDEMLRAYAERKKSMNSPMSPIRTESPALPLPGSVLSPDDMLRAYAERKRSVNMSIPTHSSSGSGGMRALYNATGQLAQTTQQYQEEDSGYTHPELTYSTSDYNSAYNDAYAAVGLGYPSPLPPSGNTPVSPKNANNPFLPSGPVEASPYPFGHHPNASIGVGAYGGAKYAIDDDEHEEDVNAGGMAGRGAFKTK